MVQLEELRLMTKVASLYYERKLRQADIAKQLDLSQATVSRLLRAAEDAGIVRITVSTPMGVHQHLEDALTEKYGLKNAIVVDGADEERELLRNLGAGAAFYLESTIRSDDRIGVSSWSETLLATAEAMRGSSRLSGVRVVQILGGVGDPAAASHAGQLTRRLASLLQGEIVMLPAPGVVGSESARRVLLEDPFVLSAISCFETLTMALVGIGTVEPSPVLARSGNIFNTDELQRLRGLGAVGDVCLHFFDTDGKPVANALDGRVVGISIEQLRNVERTIGIAGGKRKHAAIRGALQGKWVNVLVTDNRTAETLLAESPASK